MRILIAAALVAASSAYADEIYVDGDMTITFHSTACPIPVVSAFLQNEFNSPGQRASIRARGQNISACWVKDEDGDYLIIDATGRGGFVPGKEVKPGV
jgi:hypothetical protein